MLLGHDTDVLLPERDSLVEIDEGLKEDEMVIVEVSEEFKDKARVEIAEVQEGLF